MRRALILAVLVSPAVLHAQTEDPLAVTLPSGKMVHFQSEDQKSAFLAAKARTAAGSGAAPTAASAQPQPTPANLGTTALDAKPAMGGRVNVNAPTFTADYYLFAPETWVGKQITLSVADLRPVEIAPRADGMLMFQANTYGSYQAGAGQRHGGYLTVLATSAAAARIALLAGTSVHYNASGVKMTLIKGQFAELTGGTSNGTKYALIVTQ